MALQSLPKLQQLDHASRTPSDVASLLRPGPKRAELINMLLGRLLRPVSLAYLLQQIPVADIPTGLSADEQQAACYQLILQVHGVNASVDDIRGSRDMDSSTRFLEELAELVLLREGQARPLEVMQAQSRFSSELRVRAAELTSVSVNYLPSDVWNAPPEARSYTHPGQEALQVDATSLEAWTAQLHSALPKLQQHVAQLEEQVSLCSDAEWQQRSAATAESLARFLQSSSAFLRTYHASLSKWCGTYAQPQAQQVLSGQTATRSTPQSSQQQHQGASAQCQAGPPQVVMLGIGPAASELLSRLQALQALLAGLSDIRRLYTAITTCQPPLEGLHSSSLVPVLGQCRELLAMTDLRTKQLAAHLSSMAMALPTAGVVQ